MRRTLLLWSTMALSLLLASGVALAATTTRSNTASISIVDAASSSACPNNPCPADPYPSEITVQGLSGTISDVNVTLNGYSHNFPDDVAVQIVPPVGAKSVLLMSDVGSSASVSGINITLDDEATNSLPDGGQLTTGAYKPTKGFTPYCPPLTPSCMYDVQVPEDWPAPAPDLAMSASQLSEFDGKDPNGTWKLYIIDDGRTDAGTFAGGWSLQISTGSTDPPPDTMNPQITISTPPQGATYTLGQAVAADYTCTDADSGVASCQGSVNDGANIDTSSSGTKTFTVSATDKAGNTNSVSHTYTVNAPTTSCTKSGTANAETISGTSGADVICAGAGNDTVKGLGGNDILKGQSGNDKLLGGVGDDTLDGDIGTDTASYSASLTAVSASLSTNRSTGEGTDTFVGVEKLLGSSKADTLTGSGANNTLTGGGGGDTESGGAGNDKVVGSGGADFLYGEDGADSVNSKDGVNGNDTLDGGGGTDTKVSDATEKFIVNFP
jgi:Ca2+-binding RTX toxin-like protein